MIFIYIFKKLVLTFRQKQTNHNNNYRLGKLFNPEHDLMPKENLKGFFYYYYLFNVLETYTV